MLAAQSLAGAWRPLPRLAQRNVLQCGRQLSTGSRPLAASTLVKGEVDAEKAANQAVAALKDKLGSGSDGPNFTLFFAMGYGVRAQPIAKILNDSFGSDGVVVGSSAEGGVIGDSQEAQGGKFALSVLSLRCPGVNVYPFYSSDLSTLPTLGRGGSWSDLRDSPVNPSLLAFCGLPPPAGLSPQGWCTMLDEAVCKNDGSAGAKRLPTIVGGLTVGNQIFVDGENHTGGAFGIAFLPQEQSKASFETVVCQGAVPFGPTLTITGASGNHLITEIEGKNPKEVLQPILLGPNVPGTGHSMAGIFIDKNDGALGDPLAASPMSGRTNCVIRPLHQFTPEGHVVVSPIMEDLEYAPGMRLQLHCMNKDFALDDLRMRAGFDVMAHSGTPPDAAVIVSCGARGVSLYDEEGVESTMLRQAWGTDVPTTGFFAGGEIGPVGTRTFMHGYTTSCLFLRLPSQ